MRKLILFFRNSNIRAVALFIISFALAAPAMFGAFTTSRARGAKGAESHAAIRLDKGSYLAGETITISGSGFEPFESVMLQVKHTEGTIEHGLGHEAWFITADATGEFSSAWSIGLTDNAGINFVLAAIGSSRSSALAEFARTVSLTTRQLAKGMVQVKASGFNPNELVTFRVNQHEVLTAQSDEKGQVTTFLNQEESSTGETLNVQATAPDLGLVSSVVTIGNSWFVVTDRQGADDINSTQVDLNLMASLNNSSTVKKFVAAWDSTTDWTGTGQTGDVCILYDTNNNTKIDFAICVRVSNFNANPNDVRVVPKDVNKPAYIFTCGDSKNDRCAQPTEQSYDVNDIVTGRFGFVPASGAGSDTMTASASIADNLILDSDPFTGCAVGALAEDCYNPPGPPHTDTKDTVVEVHIKNNRIPAAASLVNICSYPSAGSGGNNNPFDCIVTPSTGFLVIKKNAGGDTNTSFGFKVGPPAPPVGTDTFTVKEGDPTGLINVLVGTNLKVAETSIPSGWSFSSASCKIGDIIDDPNGVIDPVTADTTNNWITGVEIKSGKVTTCTFTNTAQGGTLIVKKVVINDNGGSAKATNFSFQVNNGSATAFLQDGTDTLKGKNTLTNKTAGTYTITEPSVTGYTTTYDNCTNVSLTNGGTQTCTITNDDQAGSLIVKKVVINNNGGTKTATNFSFQVNNGSATAFLQDGADTLKGKNTLTTNAGTYSVTEPAVTGYTTTYDTCTNVVVANGGSATCTITNDDQAGTLIVKKIVINDNGRNGKATDFSFQVNGGSATGFLQDGADPLKGKNTLTQDAGTYSITEPAVSGYTATYDNCTNVSLANGVTQTCTITNDDTAPGRTLKTSQSWRIYDSVHIEQYNDPGAADRGNAEFSLYSDTTCTTTQIGSTETVKVDGSGNAATTAGVLVPGPGTYYWKVVFKGDKYNALSNSSCQQESTTITKTDDTP